MTEETPDVSMTFRLDAFNEEDLLRSVLNAPANSPQSIIKRPFSASFVPLAISIINSFKLLYFICKEDALDKLIAPLRYRLHVLQSN